MATHVDNKAKKAAVPASAALAGEPTATGGSTPDGTDTDASISSGAEAMTAGSVAAGEPASRASAGREAPYRVPLAGQTTISRLGDRLAAPFFRHRGETVVLLSLAVLGLLVYLAVASIGLRTTVDSGTTTTIAPADPIDSGSSDTGSADIGSPAGSTADGATPTGPSTPTGAASTTSPVSTTAPVVPTPTAADPAAVAASTPADPAGTVAPDTAPNPVTTAGPTTTQ